MLRLDRVPPHGLHARLHNAHLPRDDAGHEGHGLQRLRRRGQQRRLRSARRHEPRKQVRKHRKINIQEGSTSYRFIVDSAAFSLMNKRPLDVGEIEA